MWQLPCYNKVAGAPPFLQNFDAALASFALLRSPSPSLLKHAPAMSSTADAPPDASAHSAAVAAVIVRCAYIYHSRFSQLKS
jgi:hypothetical protein